MSSSWTDINTPNLVQLNSKQFIKFNEDSTATTET